MATGLQTAIWNNNLRSLALLGLYPIMIGIMVWAIAYLIGWQINPRAAQNFAHTSLVQYWPFIVCVVAGWFIIAYFFHVSMIRSLSRSHPVTRKDEPELYNLLENLCIAQGITMPRLEIIETHARNAFASGINQKSYTVTVTRGLLNSLTPHEVEAVLAHELAHIIHRDVRLLMVCVIFTGMIGFAAQLAWNSFRYNLYVSRIRRGKGGSTLIVIGVLAILWAGYMVTLFTRFAVSRRREYMADAAAVQMTKNPEAMMGALMRIAGRGRIPETTDDIAMMCLENAHPFMGLFSTHPKIEHRIKVISYMTGAPPPKLSHTGPAEKTDRFDTGVRRRNPWLIRQRRS